MTLAHQSAMYINHPNLLDLALEYMNMIAVSSTCDCTFAVMSECYLHRHQEPCTHN